MLLYIRQHLEHYLNLYNTTPIIAIVKAISNISYRPLLETADTEHQDRQMLQTDAFVVLFMNIA
jgi:hypothetical protein